MGNVYECRICGTTFRYEDGEHDAYNNLTCPSCGDRELKIVFKGADFAYLKEEG